MVLNYLFSLDLSAPCSSSAEYLSKWFSVMIPFPLVQKLNLQLWSADVLQWPRQRFLNEAVPRCSALFQAHAVFAFNAKGANPRRLCLYSCVCSLRLSWVLSTWAMRLCFLTRWSDWSPLLNASAYKSAPRPVPPVNHVRQQRQQDNQRNMGRP